MRVWIRTIRFAGGNTCLWQEHATRGSWTRFERQPLPYLLKRFAGRFALTVSLVVLEAVGWVLFPLVIGRAIDSVLAGSTRGLYEFAVLGIVTMEIAVVRRLVDSRAYARIYVTLGEEMAASAAGSSTSTRTARLGMLKEIVEFFENSLPQLINNVIGLGGTVLILAALNLPVFLGCLVVAVGTVGLYALTGGMTTHLSLRRPLGRVPKAHVRAGDQAFRVIDMVSVQLGPETCPCSFRPSNDRMHPGRAPRRGLPQRYRGLGHVTFDSGVSRQCVGIAEQ